MANLIAVPRPLRRGAVDAALPSRVDGVRDGALPPSPQGAGREGAARDQHQSINTQATRSGRRPRASSPRSPKCSTSS